MYDEVLNSYITYLSPKKEYNFPLIKKIILPNLSVFIFLFAFTISHCKLLNLSCKVNSSFSGFLFVTLL